MKPLRLRGRKTADLVRRKGRVWKSPSMTVRWIEGVPRNEAGRDSGIFVGTYATAKLDPSAVRRNRMRRRCREALRVALLEHDRLPPIQLLITPRSSSLLCDHADIMRDIRAFLTHLH